MFSQEIYQGELCNTFDDFKQLLDEVFVISSFRDIQNNQGRGTGYQPKPKAEADNPYRDLDYSGYHKNRI